MNPLYTVDIIKIKILIINNEIYYEAFIPNNDINKKLIENNNFEFEKSDSQIIIHDDIHIFHLNKIECKYSDYIEIKKLLEYTQKEIVNFKNEMIQLKSELSTHTIYYNKKQFNDKSIDDINELNNKICLLNKLFQYLSTILKYFYNFINLIIISMFNLIILQFNNIYKSNILTYFIFARYYINDFYIYCFNFVILFLYNAK